MGEIQQLLPLLIPLIILQFTLAIVSLIHLLKHPNYRFGNKIFWIVVVLFIQIIGPICYFTFGKEEDI